MNNHSTPITSLISECAIIAFFLVISFLPFGADIFKLLCLLTMIGCWIARMICEQKILFAKTSVNIPILLFFLLSIIASFHSINTHYSFQTLLHDQFVYFIVFFCMVNTIQSQGQIKRIVKVMLITCGLVCAYGLFAYYTGIPVRSKRLVATFGYYSRIAKYISLLLPIVVCLFFWYKDTLIRLSLAFLVFLCGFCLILTINRTSWVAIFVTMLFIGFAIQKKFLIYTFICACALLLLILPSEFITQAKTIVQVNKYFKSERSLGDRLLCWKVSIAMIKEHPLLGRGLGKKIFREAYQQYGEKIKNTEKQLKNEVHSEQPNEIEDKKENNAEKLERLSTAHNIILHMLVETGIVGLLAFLWLFTNVFYAAIKSWRTSKVGYEKMLLLGITASLISIFSHGLTDSFWKKPDALFLWYIIGILFAVIHNKRDQLKTATHVSLN